MRSSVVLNCVYGRRAGGRILLLWQVVTKVCRGWAVEGDGPGRSLKGPGIQTSASSAAVFEIKDFRIVTAQAKLPDGIYEVEYEGSGERVRKTGDVWEMI